MIKQILIFLLTCLFSLRGINMVTAELFSLRGINMVTAETFNDFQKFIEADSSFDGHSVFWNGSSASLIEDELDSEKTARDRYSYWNTKLYVSEDKMWSFYYIDLKNDPKTIIRSDSITLLSDKEYIEAQKADFKKESMLLEKSEYMVPFNDEALDAIASHSGFQSFKCAYGLKTIKDVTYAGYTAVFTSKYGDSYKIDCYGIGNMENIKTCFKMILTSHNG